MKPLFRAWESRWHFLFNFEVRFFFVWEFCLQTRVWEKDGESSRKSDWNEEKMIHTAFWSVGQPPLHAFGDLAALIQSCRDNTVYQKRGFGPEGIDFLTWNHSSIRCFSLPEAAWILAGKIKRIWKFLSFLFDLPLHTSILSELSSNIIHTHLINFKHIGSEVDVV